MSARREFLDRSWRMGLTRKECYQGVLKGFHILGPPIPYRMILLCQLYVEPGASKNISSITGADPHRPKLVTTKPIKL